MLQVTRNQGIGKRTIMGQEPASIDKLYQNAESLAQDFSLFPRKEPASVINGLLTEQQIEIKLDLFRNMEVDAYIEATVAPTEESTRPGSREIIKALDVPILREQSDGPLYACELELDFYGSTRIVGFITQDRAHATGVWGPQHHEAAARIASDFAIRSLPIVTFMDTPGADPYEEANANNQAHTISRLIAELCNVDVPTLGIIIGQGYSGGAIPLAASNMLLSLRTGVFSTIHPRSLASLNRRFNLSWQECARFVGVSSYELYKQGNIDGIIDYDPGEDDKISNLLNVIVSAIISIEDSTKEFVSEHPEILEHYHRNINRYLHQSETMAAVHASSTLKLRTSPTEYPNVFGVAFRYLRYLGLRRRIKSTTTTQYGRLAESEIPAGELAQRVRRERRVAFLGWMQDPDKVLYEDTLNKVWKNFVDKRAEVGDERGRIAQLIFGEPGKNYENARRDLCLVSGLHLYNRWKASSKDNLTALIQHLGNQESNSYLLSTTDVSEVKQLLTAMSGATDAFLDHLKSLFSFEGRKLFDLDFIKDKNTEFLRGHLVSELNLILEGESLFDETRLEAQNLSGHTQGLVATASEAKSSIPLNRRLLEDTLWSHLQRKTEADLATGEKDMTILEVILDDDVCAEFVVECQNLIVFSIVYDHLISALVSVARHAHESRTLPAEFIEQLVDARNHFIGFPKSQCIIEMNFSIS